MIVRERSLTTIHLSLEKRVIWFLLVMLFGVALRTYVTHSVTIVWITNLAGLLFLFPSFFRYYDSSIARYSIIYIIFGFITLSINSQYLNGSIKSIGTNINIIVFPLLLNIAVSKKTKAGFDEQALLRILKAISFLGTLSLLFAWIIDFGNIIKVFNGASVYRTEIAGFYYSKNIYGAFIALSMAADLYLVTKKRDPKRIIAIVLKIVAVILSLSRAALLLAGLIVFIFFWVNKRRTWKDYLVLVVLVAAVIGTVVYVRSNEKLNNFMLNSVFRMQYGDAGRESLRTQALDKVKDNLISSLFGVGFAGIDVLDIDVDNTYLYIWFTGGIVKLLYYLVAMIASVKKIVRMKFQDKNLYRLCMSVCLSYLAFAFFESVAVLELGLLNFLFTFYLFMIPFSYQIISNGSNESALNSANDGHLLESIEME